METCICPKCQIEKPLTQFYKNAGKKRGHNSYCMACEKVLRLAYYARNQAKLTAAKRAYDDANRELIKERGRARYRLDAERYRTKSRVYIATHRAELAEKRRKKTVDDPEYFATATRRYKQRHPDRVKSRNQNHRARRVGVPGQFTADEWRALCTFYGDRCLACQAVVKLSADHVVPVVKGGSSGIENIQPLCMPCNQSKATKTTDYRPAGSVDQFLATIQH